MFIHSHLGPRGLGGVRERQHPRVQEPETHGAEVNLVNVEFEPGGIMGSPTDPPGSASMKPIQRYLGLSKVEFNAN